MGQNKLWLVVAESGVFRVQYSMSNLVDLSTLNADSDKPDAKLIGIEYVVPAEVFEKLPEEEKKYAHEPPLPPPGVGSWKILLSSSSPVTLGESGLFEFICVTPCNSELSPCKTVYAEASGSYQLFQ